MTAMNVASIKKARIPSIAAGHRKCRLQTRIIAPVGSEFKLEYQTGSYSDGKVYTKVSSKT